MTACVANYVVKLRTKTIKGLNLTDPSRENRLRNHIINFRSKSPKEANRILFQLLYAENTEEREELLRSFEFTASEENNGTYYFLTPEQILILGNELRHQYSQSHPDYLAIEDNTNYHEELETLKKVMGNHPLLLFRAVESCKHCSFDKEPEYLCIRPLLSSKDFFQKEGLKNLGHNSDYQELLLPYANEIGNLLQAMYTAYQEEQKFLASQAEEKPFPSPFAPLAVLLNNGKHTDEQTEEDENGMVTSEESVEDNFSDLIKDYSLSDELSKFIDNRDALILNIPRSDEFWDCLKHLRNLGIDLNKLVDKEKLLWPLLNAHVKMDQAIKALKKADEDFKNAQTGFSMSNMKAIQKLFYAGQERENARNQYNAAFDEFAECCKAFEKELTK